ncbi:SURF1 family protein [Acidovorax sp. Leaf160]|uniref:SURF1 family protein n=1 Tax=Acidovorax sp. Leaf160 TaxID=1736280 RepID=UPI000A4A22B9
MTSEALTGAGPRGRRSTLIQAVLILVGIALFLGFIALGSWQVQRRAWKLELIERVDRRVHSAPVALPPVAEWPRVDAAGYEYLPVAATGRWLADKTVLTQAVTDLGAGFWVLTPLARDDGTQVLVNRGFIPAEQRAQWQGGAGLGGTPDPDPVTVQGLLRLSEPGGGFLRRNDPAAQRWHSRDVAAIAAAQGLPNAAPFFIDAGLPGSPVAAAGNASSWPRAGMTVIRFANSHLVYALTWFGLALMTVIAGVYVARYERRRNAGSAAASTFHDTAP